MKSLWGEEIEVQSTQEKAKEILSKLDKSQVSKTIKSKKTPIELKLELIKHNVLNILGHYKDNIQVIKTREELHSYIDEALKNNIIAIDTETNNSLDPLTCKLMGGCIYTPNQKSAYIPINHTDLQGNRLEWQLTEKDINEEFNRLNNTRILTHNGKFDYKVLHCTCSWDMPIYWDSYNAARLINENLQTEYPHISKPYNLKNQYILFIDPTQEKYDIEGLFEELPYEIFDPDLFAYYAATDAYMTYKLYELQKSIFENPEYEGSFHIFKEIEMPLTEVVAKMELTGIGIDLEYSNRLSIKYHKLMDDCNLRLNEELKKYERQILDWRLTPDANFKPPKKDKNGVTTFGKSKNEQLEDPIKISSPTQLAILIYDVLKFPQVSIKQPRGTGVDELTSLYRKTNSKLFSLILEMRGLDKLLNTFIDKLPNDINPTDGRVHCELFPLGTDSGRFSSAHPNLQQIPRENIEVKPMFRAPEGHSLVCCDLSAAEVRTAANASGDPQMIDAYQKGRDLYSLIASKIYNNNYEDNLEFYPEGTKIMYEGKEVICGNEKEYIEKSDNKEFSIPHFRLVNTSKGFIKASDLQLNDVLITDEGEFPIKNINPNRDNIVIKL